MRLIVDIRLCEIEDPVIWRKVAIPMELTFHSLHLIFQAAMGWQNQHLYSFKEDRRSKYFTVEGPFTEEFGIDGSKTSAAKVLWSYFNQYVQPGEERDKMYYEYDFGDGWLHQVDVLELDRSDRTSAELLDGIGACPPENCGGPHGFERLKTFLAGKISEEEYFDWMTAVLPENYNPNKFDLERMKLNVKGWKLLRR